MRSLASPPRAFVDPATAEPAFGSYAGPLPPIRFPPGALPPSAVGRRVREIVRRKRWVFVAIASDELWLSLAIVDTGYAATAFAYVFDRETRAMLFDRTVLGLPGSASVSDALHDDGVVARFASGRTRLTLDRRGEVCALHGQIGELAVDVSFDAREAPPSVSAIAALGPGLHSATEKRALAPARGGLTVGKRSFGLDSALVGYDYTNGLLPRRTRWRWAFGMGRTPDGRKIAFNIVEGFVGEAECALFVDGRVHPLGEALFAFDAQSPIVPWRLAGDGIDLRFDVGAVHAQTTNLLLVRSRFVQPVGTFSGTVRCDGVPIAIDGLPGVVEDQDVLW